MQYKGTEIELKIDHYAENGTLAVVMLNKENKSMYDILTINLDTPFLTNENCQFVDTNNMEDIEEFISKYYIGVPTGRVETSGFCVYPEYDFTKLIIRLRAKEVTWR